LQLCIVEAEYITIFFQTGANVNVAWQTHFWLLVYAVVSN